MSSTNRYLLCAATLGALILAGCAAPPPKPVVTQAAQTPEEDKTLKIAAEEYAEALRNMRDGQHAKAEQQLKEMTVKYPQLAGPYANLGILYLRGERQAEAEQAFNTALVKNPNIPGVYNQLGILYRTTGQFDKARAAYEKALAIAPDHAAAHLNLGILFDLYLGDIDQALQHYLRYQELAKPGDSAPVVKWIADLSNRKRAQQPAPPPEPRKEEAPAQETTADAPPAAAPVPATPPAESTAPAVQPPVSAP